MKETQLQKQDYMVQMGGSRVQVQLQNCQSKAVQLNKLKCFKGNQCVQLCANQQCRKNAVVCADIKCSCKNDHRVHRICPKVDLEELLTLIETKKERFPELKKSLQNQFQKMIDWIHKEQQKALKSIQQAELNENQKKLLKAVRNGKGDELKGQQVSKTFEDLKLQECRNKQIESMHNNYQLTKQIEETIEKVKNQISYCCEVLVNWVNDKSKTNLLRLQCTVSETHKSTVTEMLNSSGRKVLGYELLYRASENNFDTTKFWQKCNHMADTVTLIHTEFDKVIGGYTPLSWKKEKDRIPEEDPSLRSFVFSVTEKTKFTLKETQAYQAIYHYTDCGPIFGGGHDLIVQNNANNNDSSFAQIGYSYQNSKVKCDTKDAWQFFHGSTQSHKFKIKEWEVWHVVFDL